MANQPKMEAFSSNYMFTKEETPVRFNNIVFDESDMEALRTGNTTRIHSYVLDNKSGDETQYLPKGKFQLFKDDQGEVSIKIIPFCEKLEIPKKILGKELTQEDIQRLHNKEFVQIKDRKTDQNFYVQIDNEVNMVVVKSEKTLGIPNQILGYTLSDIEKEKLANNQLLPERIYKDSKGNYMMAQLTFSEDRKSVIFKNITELSEKKAKELIPKVNAQVNVFKNAAFAGSEIIEADPSIKNAELNPEKKEVPLSQKEPLLMNNDGETQIKPFKNSREASLSMMEIGKDFTVSDYKEKLEASLKAGTITKDWYEIHNFELHNYVVRPIKEAQEQKNQAFIDNVDATLSVYKVGNELKASEYKEKLDASLKSGTITPDLYENLNQSLYNRIKEIDSKNLPENKENNSLSTEKEPLLKIEDVVRNREYSLITAKNFNDTDLGRVPALMTDNNYTKTEVSFLATFIAPDVKEKIRVHSKASESEKDLLQGDKKEIGVASDKSPSLTNSDKVSNPETNQSKPKNQSINL